MRLSIFLFTFIIFSLSIHLTHGGIFRRYVRKHRPGGGNRGPYHHQMEMSRSRMMMMGPNMIERQFRLSRQRPWPMFVRRARAPPLTYYYPLQMPLMMQTAQPVRSRASRRYRFHERLDSSRVPQFHHQPMSARHHTPIGISTTTRLPTTSAIRWRPLDYGNPIDRDPTYDYAPPAVERVRFVSEVRPGGARRPTARANTGMLGMYSRPSPVVVPAPWKRDPNVVGRHPGSVVMPHHPHNFPPPPPPRGALPLWKLLSQKQRPRRPQRPIRPQQQQQQHQHHQHHQQPPRFIGQDPKHPLYHHQVYHDEAEVFPHIPNIVYFQPTDVSKPSYAKKNQPSVAVSNGKKPFSGNGSLKPGFVSNAQLYSKEVSSSSEFRPIKPTRPVGNRPAQSNGNKAYQFTVVGYAGPAATTPMSPVAVPPSMHTTKRPPTVLYAVKTTPETLSTTHNSVVKPLEPTESLEPEEEAASELRPVHVLPDSPSVAAGMQDDDIPEVEVEDGREQGGLDVDFDNLDETDQQSVPEPVVPNSFNVFESLLSSFEKQFGGDVGGDEEANNEEEILEVKDNHHHQRVPVFEPAEESTLRGVLLPAPDVTTSAPSRNSNFETSTSISMSVGVSSSSSSSSSHNKNHKVPSPVHISKHTPEVVEEEDDDEDDTDGYFADIKIVPTTKMTTTTSTTTTTTTEEPVPSSSEAPSTTARSTSTTSTSTAYPRLPTMPTYKRKPTPVYARKSSKAGGLLNKYSSSSSSISKEVSSTGGVNARPVPNGSGEVVIITAGRSKVKEYKPQVIANQTHLLSFDKVVSPVDGEGVKESQIIMSSDASPSTTSTTKSPLEDFDAMQLLHSWLNKS